MGSAKVTNAKPQLPMENKTFKTLSLSSIKNFFKDKKKEKAKTEKADKPRDETPRKEVKNENTVANILDTFDKLRIKEETKKEIERKNSEAEEEDELSQFAFKIIEDDRIRHSSEDSGFSETKEDGLDVVKALEKLKIEEKKTKKTQKVLTSRAPQRSNVCKYNVGPYTLGQSDLDRYKQISQINRKSLSGGQVLVNPAPETAPQDNFCEVDQALKQVEKISQTSINQTEYWQDVLDLIHADTTQKSEDFLKDFDQIIEQSFDVIGVPQNLPPAPNPIEEFSASQNLPNYEDSIELTTSILNFDNVETAKIGYIFPTPPRSENVPSPMSDQASFYPPNWENSLSPERSSPIYNSDCEKYQEISQYEELSPVSEKEEKKRERTSSISSMTMKNFKDMQKEISNEFSKKDCCQINRKTVKEVFDHHMGKLSAVDRKNLCFGVSKMDIKTAHGVLHHILLSLSTGKDQEDLQTALFVLICQRVLAQTPAAFIGDFGLSLLKSAALRCPHRPIFTRFIVHYVYASLRHENTAQGQECIFHEVDAQGDNLVIACARGGDSYALVLAEISRTDTAGDLPPLFRVHHANADGYTALHVACSQHSAASPRLHVLHVLLEHAGGDLWKGDIKGGETALHLAVNSVNCDLRVIMMIFKQLDRKVWKKLAHYQNMSSVTPLEYARSATKSTTRQNYPQEVLDFLKKCR